MACIHTCKMQSLYYPKCLLKHKLNFDVWHFFTIKFQNWNCACVIFQFALLEQLSKMQLHIGQIHHISSQLTQVGKRNIFPEVCLVFPPLKFLLTLKILKKPVNMVQGGGDIHSNSIHPTSIFKTQYSIFIFHTWS